MINDGVMAFTKDWSHSSTTRYSVCTIYVVNNVFLFLHGIRSRIMIWMSFDILLYTFHYRLHNRITTFGRNSQQVDVALRTPVYVYQAVISRTHARIVRHSDRVKLFDDSRNGVFVNNVKIDGIFCNNYIYIIKNIDRSPIKSIVGSCILEEGDTIVFGHKNGEAFPVGKRVRQPNSPFQFMVSLCSPVTEFSYVNLKMYSVFSLYLKTMVVVMCCFQFISQF